MVRGRDLLFQALRELGARFLFGNPGTTELPVIDGCNAHPEVQYITALHEDIAVGMAMGYARMAGTVGVANLHVAPGLAHGLGNLYNAWRAGIPLVITAGQQDTRFLIQEPILTADLVQMARPFTKWAHEVRHVDELPVALHRAFKEALAPPTGPVFLSLPADVMLAETSATMPAITRIGSRIRGDEAELDRAAELLLRAERPLIVAGDGVGLSGAWPELVELAERLGAPVMTEALSTLANFPNSHPHWVGGLPAAPAGVRKAFAGVDVVLLCGYTSQAPAAFFDGAGPLIPPEVRRIYLHQNPWEIGKNQEGAAAVLGDVQTSLRALCDRLAGAAGLDPALVERRTRELHERTRQRREKVQAQLRSVWDQVPVHPARVAAELAAVLPEDAVLVNEAISNTGYFVNLLTFREPLSYWGGKGGGLGHSMPAALGIKLAAPRRTMVNVVGDGTFLYYPQSLWSAANLGLPVIFLILNNSSYRILKQGLQGMGGPWGPPGAYPPGLDLAHPAVNYAALAQSFGVAGERVTEPAQLRPALERALQAGAPYLLDVVIDPEP